MHLWTVTRSARRIVRETQYLEVEAEDEEEAIRIARNTSDGDWEEYQFLETWTEETHGHEAKIDESCGCEECDAPEPPSEALTQAAERYRENINRGDM